MSPDTTPRTRLAFIDPGLRKARRLLVELADFPDRERIDVILVWNGSNLRLSLAVYLARQRGSRTAPHTGREARQ